MGDSGYIRRIRGFGRDVKLFLAYTLLANVGIGVFQVIFNLYLVKLHFHEDYIGAYSAVQTVAMALSAASMGALLNRFGVWRCIAVGVSSFLAVSLALAFAEHAALLLVLGALNGLGMSFLFTATMPFIVEWVRRDQRQHVAAVSFSLMSLAATLGALLGGSLPDLLHRLAPSIGATSVPAYRWTLVAGTLVAAIGLVPLFLMGEARRSKRREEPAAAVPETVAGRRQVRHDMGTFVLIGGLMSLGAGMVIPFYNVYLTTLGMSSRDVGYVFALGSLSAAVIGLTAPAVSRRFGAIRAVALLRLSIVPFYALLIVAPGAWIAILAYQVRQVSISMAWPIDSTFIADVLPPRARAGVFGWRSSAWNAGYALASLIGGRLIVHAGYGWTFGSLILFSLLSMALFSAYFGRHPLVRAGQLPAALPRRARPAGEPLVLPAVDADAAPEPGAAD